MSTAASLKLPRFFGDHMVLQRDRPVQFRGWAEPGAVVTVDIDGAARQARADEDGRWSLSYPARPAGGPYTVIVRSGGEIRLDDVMFGDVWLAGGQSNMEWKIGWGVDNREAEIGDSDYPAIRYFEVPQSLSSSPRDRMAGGRWRRAGPDTIRDFSAVAWFFAKHNHKDRNVPVGIIDSTWGGTPAEAWVHAAAVKTVEGYEAQAREVLDAGVDWEAKIEKNNAVEARKWDLIADRDRVMKLKAWRPDYDDSGWHTVTLPNREPLSDFVWLRKNVQLADPSGPARLHLGELVQEAYVFVNARLAAVESWQDNVSDHPLPPDALRKGDNLIAVRVVNSWDNKVFAGKAGDMWLETGGQRVSLEGEWRYSNTIEPAMPEVQRYNWKPGFLYNAMIHPLVGYDIRGVIWYQGESNTDRPAVYEPLFKTLITDWRARWGRDFPFLFVQLANFIDDNPQAEWARLRESQAAALELPATGMAVAVDIGNPEDVHPRNKQDVGKRLWLAARKVAFGDDVVYSGPVYKKHEVKGDQVIVSSPMPAISWRRAKTVRSPASRWPGPTTSFIRPPPGSTGTGSSFPATRFRARRRSVTAGRTILKLIYTTGRVCRRCLFVLTSGN